MKYNISICSLIIYILSSSKPLVPFSHAAPFPIHIVSIVDASVSLDLVRGRDPRNFRRGKARAARIEGPPRWFFCGQKWKQTNNKGPKKVKKTEKSEGICI